MYRLQRSLAIWIVPPSDRAIWIVPPGTAQSPCQRDCTTQSPCHRDCTAQSPCHRDCTAQSPCRWDCTAQSPCHRDCTAQSPCAIFEALRSEWPFIIFYNIISHRAHRKTKMCTRFTVCGLFRLTLRPARCSRIIRKTQVGRHQTGGIYGIFYCLKS